MYLRKRLDIKVNKTIEVKATGKSKGQIGRPRLWWEDYKY